MVTKFRAGIENSCNRIVTCLNDTSETIADSLCSTILIATQSNTCR